ncbi:SlyX family protein [Palleronia sediminis]|uniref:SlyX family protein n=1 Tax=Palleronia sediminis TaxID=2547833 RepID=A0A4R6ABN1_9RHOB|nr:SlyX family protein [Palleronia sediminis]TDL81371.1 SlyX family protein [Palleronia sediminis]
MSDETEERLAHLIRANDELSDEVARLGRMVERLEARVARLMAREADGGAAVFADRPPPHY